MFLKVGYSRNELEVLGLPDVSTKLDRASHSVLASRLLHFLMRCFHADSTTIGDAGVVAKSHKSLRESKLMICNPILSFWRETRVEIQLL